MFLGSELRKTNDAEFGNTDNGAKATQFGVVACMLLDVDVVHGRKRDAVRISFVALLLPCLYHLRHAAESMIFALKLRQLIFFEFASQEPFIKVAAFVRCSNPGMPVMLVEYVSS